jgi:Ion channel
MLLNLVSIVAGVAVILFALNDVFQSVIVPRATGRRYRLSAYVWRWIWYVWPRVAWRLDPGNGGRREEILAVFAPFTLVLLVFLWAALLIVGFGLVLWGLRSGITPARPTFGAVLYYAGTSVVTIGYGDIVSHGWAARLASVLAGLAGLSLLSITTAYLFALFAAFQNREMFVVMVAARAGAPPSGVNLLAIAGYSRTREDLPQIMFNAQRWAAGLMESHLAYPVLTFFRSSHDDQSWVGTLGTLLDAATLIMTTIDGAPDGQARIFYNVGRHATFDLSNYMMIRIGEETVGIERSEFDDACGQLVEAGYKLRDRDEAWKRFSDLRSNYAARLNALARFFESPPLQWIGDRSSIGASAHD